MLRDYRYHVRKWLNKPGFQSTAFIYGTIQKANKYHNPKQGISTMSVDGALSLSDCSRKIDLDFFVSLDVKNGEMDPNSLADLKNVEYKAILLRDEVANFCEEILTACQEARDWAVEEMQDYKNGNDE